MNLRRCFCFLLACAVICSGLFSVSASAVEIDGYTVITSFANGDTYTEFVDKISVEGIQGDRIYIVVDITPSSVIEKDTVFNFSMTFSAGTANSWSCAHLAMYDSSGNLIGSTQDVTIDSGSVTAQDVQASTNISRFKLLIQAINPLWIVSGSNGSDGTSDPTEPEVTAPVSFTINGVTFYADSEQKWTEWIETDYNTAGIKKGSSSITSASGYGLQLNGSYVTTYDSIVNGGVYTHSGQAYVNYGGSYYPDIESVWDKEIYSYALINSSKQLLLYTNFYSEIKDSNYYWYAPAGHFKSYKISGGSWVHLNTVDLSTSGCYMTSAELAWASWDDDRYSDSSTDSGAGDSGNTDVSTMISNFDFTVTSVSIGEETEKGLMSGILGWIKNIYNGIINLPKNFANAVSGFFDNVVNAITALGDYLLDGIKSLFVPSEQDMVDNHAKWEKLLEDRFGAVYESTSIIDDWAQAFTYGGTQSTISIPTVTVNLAGTPFSFGGWDVDLIPDGFEGIIDTLKLISNIACTLLFVNGMKKRLEAILS